MFFLMGFGHSTYRSNQTVNIEDARCWCLQLTACFLVMCIPNFAVEHHLWMHFPACSVYFLVAAWRGCAMATMGLLR